MSEQAIPQTEPSEEDVNTTPPNPAVNAGNPGWKMPEPVFRKTSGYLPQGFEKRYSQEDLKPLANENESTAEMPAPDLTANIEPQPEVDHTDDSLNTEQPAAAIAAPKKRSAAKLIFTVLGLLLAFGLVVVFIAVIYFLYFMPISSGPFE